MQTCYYSVPGVERSIVMSVSVCLFVRLCVCPDSHSRACAAVLAYIATIKLLALSNSVTPQVATPGAECAVYAVFQYDTYLGFMDDLLFIHNGQE